MERLQEPGRNGHVDVQVADGEAVAKQTNNSAMRTLLKMLQIFIPH
jgi:predicted methyltransferase MtxX (methanogen marker protein 4)